MTSQSKVRVGLLLIVALGAGLRLSGLEFQSLWFDEICSWRAAAKPSLAGTLAAARSDVHPPGYYILLHLVVRVAGDSEVALRLPSAIAGIFVILMTYFLGRRLYSVREGLLGAALMAVSWAPLYYSQEARAYSLLLLAALVASHLYWMLLSNLQLCARPSWPAIAYPIAACAMAYLHYFGLLLVCLHAMGAAFHFRRSPVVLGRLALVFGAAALCLTPMVPAMLSQSGRASFWMVAPGPDFLVRYGRFVFSRSGALAAMAVILLGTQLVSWLRHRDSREDAVSLLHPGMFLSLWFLAPLGAAFLASHLLRPVLTYRNLILCLPAAYLLLARAIVLLPVPRRLRLAAAVLVPLLTLLHVTVGRGYYSKVSKGQFREAALYLDRYPSPVPRPLILSATDPGGFDYYLSRFGSALRTDLFVGWQVPLVALVLEERAPQHVWLLRGHDPVEPEFLAWMTSHMELLDHGKFRDTDVWLFEIGKRSE